MTNIDALFYKRNQRRAPETLAELEAWLQAQGWAIKGIQLYCEKYNKDLTLEPADLAPGSRRQEVFDHMNAKLDCADKRNFN